MKKLNIGELVNDNFSQNDIIELISSQLETINNGLANGLATQNLGTLGASIAQLSNVVAIAKTLNEKVNGKKENVVL